ncbi:MAG: indolepyruvate ferredoxin oxidoreductase subunit alpha, partial [Caldisericaceae bacterium]
LESGISVATTYPGTPSSEIGDVFFEIADEAGVYFEFSTNEKVAIEVAAAGAVSGLRSFVWMKHVGLNVAADSFISLAYTGVRGGMIVLTADDPSMFSSQNEQDNRWYARLGNVPLLEPSNPQEIKDLMGYAFELSEKLAIPVLMRTTTRVSHMRGVVQVGDVNVGPKVGNFVRDPSNLVPLPANAYKAHKKVIEKMSEALEIAEDSEWNRVVDKGGSLGIIASGPAYNYVMDVVNENNLNVKILKLTFSYPFPEKLVTKFLNEVDAVLVAEEVDPIMEKEVYAVIGEHLLNKKVFGKLDGTLPMIYEYSPDIIRNALSKALSIELKGEETSTSQALPPQRPPVFCPGCPHRGVYDSVKKVVGELGIDAIFPSDIGCYTLGYMPPFNEADYILSMGSSIGTGSGLSKFSGKRVVSFIGDSTFFHAGIPGLINAVRNNDRLTVVILDNRITAMTGGQPNPGMALDGKREISIEEIVKAIGVNFLRIVNPYNLKATEEALKEALLASGVSVVIARQPCVLITPKKKVTFTVDPLKCTGCKICINEIACPAMSIGGDGKVVIDETLCTGCGVCVQTCPEKAIIVRR